MLSHSDADHHGAVPKICRDYHVKRVIRDGLESDTATWQASNTAIEQEVAVDEDGALGNLFKFD
jgi:beta-lactamase superfamily II metal-dependent hydrolase